MALLLEIVKVILKMLTLIKPGIAMGIAEDHIKTVASDVTDTVDNEAISEAIYKYFKI